MFQPDAQQDPEEVVSKIIPLFEERKPFWDQNLWEVLEGDDYTVFVLAMKVYGIFISDDEHYIIERKKSGERIVALVGQHALWEMGVLNGTSAFFTGTSVYRRE